eukprot:TRINITY_DN14429_c0_g2_i5.p1 TRINITY_DN14429_c0_g2~~TRINITY_DN14429_c0_g2_i5.p1  ORF type:complete len:1726 (+),score=476.64 TRINITY_DN14429_c0_g2_i5:359-5536(+)
MSEGDLGPAADRLSTDHPLVGAEHEVAAALVTAADCASPVPDLGGKIALVMGGVCSVSGAALSERTGAIATVVVLGEDVRIHQAFMQFTGLRGTAPESGLNVTAAVSYAFGKPVLDMLAAGTRVRGRIAMDCDMDQRTFGEEEVAGVWDFCPMPGEMVCEDVEGAADALCSGCVLEAVVGGAPVCLYSSTVVPLRAENSLASAATSDGRVFDASVVEVSDCAGAAAAFVAADFVGTSGQVVFVRSPGQECDVAAVRAADGAGVAAVVLQRKFAGFGVSVAVHSLLPADMERVSAAGTNGTFQVLVRLGVGLSAPATEAPTPTPTPASTASGFSFSWLMGVCTCVGAVLVAVNGFVFARQFGAAMRLQLDIRQVAETGQKLRLAGRRRIPLSLASLGVSVTLLVCISTVTFVLVYEAGQEATSTALDDGDRSMDEAHASTVAQVHGLRDQVLSAYARLTRLAVRRILAEGTSAGRGLSALLHGYTAETADEVFSKAADFVSEYAGERGGLRWVWSIRTVGGHYGGFSARSVVDENGAKWVEIGILSLPFKQRLNLTVFDPATMFNRRYGSAVDAAAGMAERSHAWYVCERPQPISLNMQWFLYSNAPLSLLFPMHSRGGQYVGALEGVFSLPHFTELLAEIVNTDETANMTAVLLNEDSGAIVGSTINEHDQVPVAQATNPWVFGDTVTVPLTLKQMPVFELNAADEYLRHHNNGTLGGEGVHEFDQAEWYARTGQQTVSVIDINFDSGEPQDVSAGKWQTRLGGSSSVVEGCRSGRCLDVDGTSSLEIFRNMSTDLPQVRDGRNASSPNFNPFWNTTVRVGDVDVVHLPMQNPFLPATPVEWYPLLREPFLSRQHTITMWVRPRRTYEESRFDFAIGPSLWIDDLVEESLVRVTAGGRMVVQGVSQGYACVTDPYPGGFPAGVWTHVAAQLDTWNNRKTLRRQRRSLDAQWHAQMCRVYVNGSLHSEGPVSSLAQHYDRLHSSPAPYRVGHGFDGQIDSLQVFNVSLSADELSELMRTGRFVRRAPSRRVYALLERVREEGLPWLTLITLPRDDVMRSVDSIRNEQQRRQAERRESVEDDLAQRSVETLLVTAVVALLSVTVFLLFNGVLTRPIGRLARDMLDVAVLRTDLFVESRHVVSEIDVMNRAMRVLIDSVTQYRSYLPQAVLAELDAGLDVVAVDPPQGSVAICFTDICGSTRLWEAHPCTMNVALELHNDVLRAVQREHSGYEVKTIGDAFMVAFADAASAVLYGVRLQEELLDARWPECPEFESVSQTWAPQQIGGAAVWCGIAVRCGVGFGEVADERNPLTDRADYRGRVVNYAARLESTCPVGLVQISGECKDAAAADPRMKQLTFVQRSGVELKGIGRDVTTHVVSSEKLKGRVLVWQASSVSVNPLSGGKDPATVVVCSVPHEGRRLTMATDGGSDGSSRSSFRNTQMPASVRAKMQTAQASVAELRHMDGDTEDGDARQAAAQFGSNVQWMLACATRTQGKVMSVLGSSAQVSWNVITSCANASPNMSFAFLYDCASHEVHMGTCSGVLLHGQLGDTRQRFHTTAGLVPRCASALAKSAAELLTGCLVVFIPETPAAEHSSLRPVDRWLVQTDQIVTVEEFLPERYRVGMCLGGDSPVFESPRAGGGGGAAYREAFHRAVVHSDADALAEMRQRAGFADSVLAAVVAAVSEHQQRHPSGMPYRHSAAVDGRQRGLPPGVPGSQRSCFECESL